MNKRKAHLGKGKFTLETQSPLATEPKSTPMHTMSTNPSVRYPDCEQGKPGRNRGKKEEEEDDKGNNLGNKHMNTTKSTEKEIHNQKQITLKLPHNTAQKKYTFT